MVLTRNNSCRHYTNPIANAGDIIDPTKVTSRHEDQHSKDQNPNDPIVEDNELGENSSDDLEDDHQDTLKDDYQDMPTDGGEKKDDPDKSDPVVIMETDLNRFLKVL
uniref:Uncharacterized protein n=1 Tax=Cannabis sativa TaxID=3483 RepID=A0A803NJI3_CANSA